MVHLRLLDMHLVGDVPEEIALQHTIVVQKGMAVAEVDIINGQRPKEVMSDCRT